MIYHQNIFDKWIRVSIPRPISQTELARTWCHRHEGGKFYYLHAVAGRPTNFYFEKEEDATLFALKWA